MKVYKIENKENGKVYIGQTTVAIEKRWSQHKSKGLRKTSTYPLYLDIGHYGADAFTISIIDETATTKQELNDLEISYIKQYNSLYPNGYNIASGPATTGTKAWNRGLKMPDEVKQKLSIAHMGQIPSNRRSILCLNNKRIYASLKDAADHLNLKVSKISLVLNGHRRHTGGYVFTSDLSSIPTAKAHKPPQTTATVAKPVALPLTINASRPVVYFLVGAFGSGKTWIANQLTNKFTVLSHDKDGIVKAEAVMLSDHAKVYLYESPVHISSFIKKNQHQFEIRTVVVQEDVDVLKSRIEGRIFNTIPEDRVEKIAEKAHRMKVIAGKADKYKVVFSGTSQDCLTYLQSI